MTPRQIAVSEGKPTYDGKMCHRGHGTLRYTSNKGCVSCRIEYAREYNATWQPKKRCLPMMDFAQDNIDTRW